MEVWYERCEWCASETLFGRRCHGDRFGIGYERGEVGDMIKVVDLVRARVS